MNKVFILLVDDDASFLDAMKDYLTLTNECTVECALSAEEALKKMKNTMYDAVVSDYSMPDVNGVELLKSVRTFSNIPFILFTGVGDEQIINEAIENEVDFYLEKGEDPDVLFPKLFQMIQFGMYKKQTNDETREMK